MKQSFICSLVVLIVALGVQVLMAQPVAAQGSVIEVAPIDRIADVPRRGRLALLESNEARDVGNYEKSAKILGDLLRNHPNEDHFLIRFHYGNDLRELDRQADAVVQYQRAVKLEPRHYYSWVSLGQAAYEVEEYELAGDALKNGFDIADTKTADLLYFSAVSYLQGGNSVEGDSALVAPKKRELFTRASELFEMLIDGYPEQQNMDWYRALIASYLELEDKDAGVDAVERCVQAFPEDPGAWELAFQNAVGSSDYREAAVMLTVKGYLAPLSRSEKITLGDLYRYIETPAAAFRYYEEALADSVVEKDLESLASAYLGAFETDKALKTLSTAVRRNPTYRLWSLMGDVYFRTERYDKAYEAYASAAQIEDKENDGRPHLMMGFCKLELKDRHGAINEFNRATSSEKHGQKANDLIKQIEQLIANDVASTSDEEKPEPLTQSSSSVTTAGAPGGR